jgi:putative cardiolipin synthase
MNTGRRLTSQTLPALFLALLLSACTSVPFDYPRTASQSIPAASDTRFGASYTDWGREHGDLSGFIPLYDGIDALGARLRMMEAAETSIDAQYFLIKPDQAGDLFLGKLLRAADRGVRVRLLLDDIFTPRMDSALSLLNTHPNIEVRLYNPLSRNSPVFWNMLFDFKRTNRRMHNKAFVVDGSLAIMGGRNIAEEYFELEPQQEFDDYELLITGPIVPQISHSFDVFWNSELAVPMQAFGVPARKEKLQKWLTIMDEVASGERPSPYTRAMNTEFLEEIRSGQRKPAVAPAQLVYDPPEKLTTARRDQEHRELVAALRNHIEETDQELIVVTPYFVPRAQGVANVKRIVDRGVRVVILTNSLASTNHVAVHSGYARYRRELLEAGAELYELKVDEVSRRGKKREEIERVTLHTKAVVFDRKTLFAGSLNFDPRSIAINTEIGLFIDSPEKASGLAQRIDRAVTKYTYQVQLSPTGKMQWVYRGDGTTQVYDSEPQAGFWRKFSAGFYGLLPIEDQL